jgi:alpha-tubulin suppressor-like RCC1 family protein
MSNHQNPYGQLGLGHQINLTTVEELKPQHFTGANVREVVCGYYWTTFVTNDNNAHSCGDNKRHQCGLPEAEEYLVPTLLEYPGLKNNVETVVCGHYYSLFMSCEFGI